MNALDLTHVFPLVFANEELRLLTAIVLGSLFGFSLERGGFGNARKLAAQFYFRDMTVFKVMFTAILVAMVGLYTLVSLGMVDMAMMWVNPTFMWAQVVGGFLLGVGFIMSGLCPGTSVVSAASGRWDAWMTFAGIFVGILVFVVAIDLFPALERLYSAGEMGVSLLPAVFGVPPLVFALAVVMLAGLAFVGAEKVEAIFQREHGQLALEPRARPRMKVALAGALGLIGLFGLGAAAPEPTPATLTMEPVAPLELAEAIIAGDPHLFIVDLRTGEAGAPVPGAFPAADEAAAAQLLESAPAGSRVVVYDATGSLREAPATWPTRVSYHYLEGGWAAWEFRVLTPALDGAGTVAEREAAARQNQISAYFTGGAVQAPAIDAPPPMPMSVGGAKKKKAGGC